MSEETKAILQKIVVVRDEDGYFLHPDLLHFWQVTMDGAEHCTSAQWQELCVKAGIVTRTVYLGSEDIDHPAYIAYFDNGGNALEWDPSPPPGWWLIEIGDTEDGPYAVWATERASPKEQTDDLQEVAK